jgi:hypothetical protein
VGTTRWSRREIAATIVAFVVACLLLGLTSNPGPAQINDTRAAAYASWSLGTTGSPALPEVWPASRNYWGAEGRDGRVYVNRFPGVAYWAAPAYAVVAVVSDAPAPAHPFLIDLRPAGWTAALTVALAGLVAYALLRRLVPRVAAGVAAGLLVFGTGLWPVAADALWPHGPSALLLLVVLWGWRRGSWPAGGLGAAGVVLVRPHLVVALAVLAGWIVWRERERWGVGVALVAGAGTGLLALSAYTSAVFGRFAPTAGYDAQAHLVGVVDRSPWRTLLDLGLALGGLPRGLLLFTPVAAVALVAAVLALVMERRGVPGRGVPGRTGDGRGASAPTAEGSGIPGWTVAAAVAGFAYLVIQVRAVGPLGGRDFFGPRTSLETLVLAVPLLTVAASRVAARSRVFLGVLGVAAVVSVGLNAYGAIARSIAPAQVARWEAIDETVRRDFGDLELGEVDLVELSGG